MTPVYHIRENNKYIDEHLGADGEKQNNSRQFHITKTQNNSILKALFCKLGKDYDDFIFEAE